MKHKYTPLCISLASSASILNMWTTLREPLSCINPRCSCYINGLILLSDQNMMTLKLISLDFVFNSHSGIPTLFGIAM